MDAAHVEVEEETRTLVLVIYNHAEFSKLNVGYERKYHKIDNGRFHVGKELTEVVDMGTSRPCIHSKRLSGRVFLKMVIGRQKWKHRSHHHPIHSNSR